MLKIALIKSTEYLLVSVNMVKDDKNGGSKYKSIRKGENKIIEILAKLKS